MAAAVENQLHMTAPRSEPLQQGFYPYDYNGGCVSQHPRHLMRKALLRRCRPSRSLLRRTVLAVAGPNYSIVAGDTRMSTGFSIKSRNISKIYEMCARATLPMYFFSSLSPR